MWIHIIIYIDDETLKILGYVVSSTYRTEVMKTLMDKPKIPSQIAADIGIKLNHISNVLNQLKKKGLIRLINPEDKKGRIYELTDVGLEIAKVLN